MSRYGILRSKEFKEHLNQRRYEREVEERLEEERIQEQTRQRQISEKIEKEKRKLQETFESLKSDWRSELSPQEEQVEIVEELNIKVPEKLKSNWRKELNERMTTGGSEIQLAPTDVPLDTLDAANAASFTDTINATSTPELQDGLAGAQIVSNGTGSGSNGGFNLGRSYLSFNGVGGDATGPGREEFDNIRLAILTPVDASRATTIEISAIVGNGSNGGEAPSVGQDIILWYTDPENPVDNVTAALDDTGNFITVVPYNGSGSLRTYSVTLPSNEFNNLRKQGIQFILLQDQGINPTTTNDNFGITEIKIKRTTPISVIAPLDTPEAVSFFRVGTEPNRETPKQRYRRVVQQLLASRSYTNQMFGSNFPGTGAVPPGESGDTPGVEIANYQKKLSKYQKDLAAYEKYTAASKKESERLSKAVDVARAEYLKPGQTVAQRQQSLQKLQAAIKAGTDHASFGLRNPDKVPIKPTPPTLQTKSQLTPQQLANIDKQIKDLQRQSEKNKQDAVNNQWRAVGELAMGALQAAALLNPIPGDEAIVAGALAVKTGAGSAGARAFAKENPGKYNPFLPDRVNRYFMNSYEPQGQLISEKRKLKSPEEVLNKIPGYYDGKPAPLGFPDQPPPQQLPNGFHPDYGQRGSMYNTLDKTSAMSMPPTGNPEIDKKVEKAKKQPK